MEPKHLVYLATIIDKGSITAASEHLCITQPTLTRAMATLEMQAGRQLFSRSRFGVQSTEIGEALAREGRAILRTMDTAREQISRYQLGIHKELRVAAGPFIGAGVVSEVLERFNDQFPGTGLTVTIQNPSAALEDLLDDQVDLVIAPDPSGRQLPGIRKQLASRDVISIFCGRRHPLVNKEQLTLDDLAQAEWFSMGLATLFEKQILEMLTRGGIKRVRTRVIFRNDANILLHMLRRGRQLAVLPRLPVLAINHPEIVELDINLGQQVSRDIYFWTREGAAESELIQSFYQLMLDVIEGVNATGSLPMGRGH